jgi:hypothetical protein
MADTAPALMYAIIAKDPDPVAMMGLGDTTLWTIIERGLRKDPDQRWQAARELGAELARWLVARGHREDITGASLHQQWFERIVSGTDLLASLAPAPRAMTGSLPPGVDVDVTDFDATVEMSGPPWERETEESTFTGGFVSIAPHGRSTPRLAAMGFGCAAFGALLAITTLGGHSEASRPVLGATLSSVQASEVHPGLPPPLQTTSTMGLSPELCLPVATASTSDENRAASDETAQRTNATNAKSALESRSDSARHRARKVRRVEPATSKSSALKNPFQ